MRSKIKMLVSVLCAVALLMCMVTPALADKDGTFPWREETTLLEQILERDGFLDGIWYPCRIRKEDQSLDPVEGLDVSLLQKLLLEPVLGIKDPKTDKRIDFVGGIRGLFELEHRVHTDCTVAFAMYPTTIEELFAVADAGLLMPPKSTWFEPKLRSGLFIHEI